jgi:hypothetical protein
MQPLEAPKFSATPNLTAICRAFIFNIVSPKKELLALTCLNHASIKLSSNCKGDFFKLFQCLEN